MHFSILHYYTAKNCKANSDLRLATIEGVGQKLRMVFKTGLTRFGTLYLMFASFSICNCAPDPELASCDKVQYCCQDHKELHFPIEQDQPYPFIVKYRPDVGRYMVASR